MNWDSYSGLSLCNEKKDNAAIKPFYFFFLISDIYVCLLPLSNISNASNWLDRIKTVF